jgi:hypothetical protein
MDPEGAQAIKTGMEVSVTESHAALGCMLRGDYDTSATTVVNIMHYREEIFIDALQDSELPLVNLSWASSS